MIRHHKVLVNIWSLTRSTGLIIESPTLTLGISPFLWNQDLMYTISVLSSLILSLFDVAQDLMSATQDAIDAMALVWAEGSNTIEPAYHPRTSFHLFHEQARWNKFSIGMASQGKCLLSMKAERLTVWGPGAHSRAPGRVQGQSPGGTQGAAPPVALRFSHL